VSDQSTPSVQPEGQGGEETQGSGLYDLNSAPEEYRPFLEAELKKIEGNATKKFQEHADFRKQWEPYAELGLNDVPHEEVQDLLRLREIAQDPESFDQWLTVMAQQRGLLDQAEGDPVEYEEEDGGEPDFDFDALIEQKLQERLGPIQQQQEEQQREQRVSAAQQQIDSELASLKEAHGEFDDEAVCQLALAFADEPDAIQKGFERYQQITGGAQRSLVESKVSQPGGAVEGGPPNTAPEKVQGFGEAKRAARERFGLS
jgi:hypothetical protein